MKKLLISLFSLLAIGLIAAAVAVAFFLGDITKEAINKFGPMITETDFSVESVQLNPLSGSGTVKGFLMGNPQGFKGEKALSVESIKVDIDLPSIFDENPVTINKLHLVKPMIVYERTFSSSNMADIVKNVRKVDENLSVKMGDDTPTEQERAAELEAGLATVRFIIKEVIIEGGKVGMNVAGKTLSLPMPKVQKENIGVGVGGTDPSDALSEVLEGLLNGIGQATAEASRSIFNEGADTVKGFKNTIQQAVGPAE